MKELCVRQVIFAAAFLLSAGQASATGLKFNSMPVFLGQVQTQHGGVGLGYVAQIMSTTPDAQGYIEIFTHTGVVQTQESYADHLAIQTRAACNATGDNSCVLGVPGWQETLVSVASQTRY
jgi:hypothetical protein